MRTKYFLFLVALLLIALSTASAQTAAQKSGGTAWSMKGDYFDACSCQYVCMCDFGADPQMHDCQGVGAIQIKEGKYGETSLNGVKAAFYMKPGVEFAYYVDESATDAQRQGLTKILDNLFTGAGKNLGTKTAKVNFAMKSGKTTLEVPNVMTASGEQVLNAKKPITVVNGHNPLADKVNAGKASLNQFKDYTKDWKYEGRNAWLGTFDKHGTVKE